MGKKEGTKNLEEEIKKYFERWEHLRDRGGTDPLYADGGSMNYARNYIINCKNRMVEQYGTDYAKYPEIFYRELPPEVDDDYMARAGEIRDGAVKALECYLSDPNFQYLLANRDALTETEARQICLHNVLGYASGLASAIKKGDMIVMRRHEGRPENYLESFARCATQMMRIMDDRKKEPEQVPENGQLSLFQLGVGVGQHR